ncbi:MAG: exodeoxyribonuclease VII small subunit [Clostridia bacterium]|nr:exodeoxyribonuclease VII small subunit [Clostridia bacterium]MBQ6172334.1 exodeoxyribonuclease VII small subunit [Clostridia bacterium]
MTFEQAMNRMEEITARLADGNLGIDESLALYEEGVRLAAFCDEKLKDVQRKITVLQEKENG